MNNNTTAQSILNSRNEEIVRSYTAQGYLFPSNPSSGSLVVGPDQVMKSAAGYYIGAYCFEYLSYTDDEQHEWEGPSPYCRHTHYMTKANAEAYLELNN